MNQLSVNQGSRINGHRINDMLYIPFNVMAEQIRIPVSPLDVIRNYLYE